MGKKFQENIYQTIMVMLMPSPCILWLFLLCSHITSLWLQSRSRSQHTYVHLALKLLRDCLVTGVSYQAWFPSSLLGQSDETNGNVSQHSPIWEERGNTVAGHTDQAMLHALLVLHPMAVTDTIVPADRVVLIPSLCAHSSRAVALIYGATLRTRLKTYALNLAHTRVKML